MTRGLGLLLFPQTPLHTQEHKSKTWHEIQVGLQQHSGISLRVSEQMGAHTRVHTHPALQKRHV